MTVSGTTVRATIISMEPPGGAEKFRCWNMTVKLENTEKYGEKYCNAAQQNHSRAEKVIEPNQARSESACGYPL